MPATPFTAHCRLWISGKDGTYLGAGRVALLSAIHQCGSIAKAAASMNMSYVKAWKLVKRMNAEAEEPLVIKSTGGMRGGGSVLSPLGLHSIQLFSELQRQCSEFVNAEMEQISWASATNNPARTGAP